jgi:hypothetical protein
MFPMVTVGWSQMLLSPKERLGTGVAADPAAPGRGLTHRWKEGGELRPQVVVGRDAGRPCCRAAALGDPGAARR